jgi:hypothetical protein
LIILLFIGNILSWLAWLVLASTIHGCIVAYSLGNFISNQKDPHTDSGLIFQFTLTKNFTTGETNVQQGKNIPTAVVRYWEKGKRSYRVIALSDLLNDPTLLNSSGKSEDYYQSMWTETLEMMEHESVDGSTF